MKKFLAIVGMVGIFSMNVGAALAAKEFSATGVNVGSQTGTLTAGTAGSVTFPVTVTGVDGVNNGAAKATLSVAGLPAGVSYSPTGQQSCSAPSCVITLTLTATAAASAVTGLTFTVTATGSAGGSANANGSLTISGPAPTNTAPVANAQSVTTNEDVAAVITLTGTDADLPAQTLTFSTSSNPTHGTLSSFNASTGAVTYTPSANYNGTDSFTFKVHDGTVNSSVATVSITVNAVNDAPTVTLGANQTVNEDAGAQTVGSWISSYSVGGGSDESAQTVSYVVTNTNNALFSTQPAVAADGTLTYTPATNANGGATVTVHIKDNGGTANGGVDTSTSTQTFTITVNPVNDAPIISTISSQTVNETSTLSFSLSGSDIENSPLTYTLATSVAGASIVGNQFSWTPTETQDGVYTLVAQVSDGSLFATTSFQVTVNEVNVAPSSADATVATHQNTALPITLTGSDTDSPAQQLTFTITTDPAHGTLSSLDSALGTVTYTPDNGYNGPDSFSYKVNDTVTDSPVATITINVNDLAPTLASIPNATVAEGATTTYQTVATDLDIAPTDILSYSLTNTAVANSTIDSNGLFSFSPDETQGPGTYFFTVQVSDGGLTDSKTFHVDVTEVNETPVALLQTVVTDEDTATTTTLVATDVDVPAQTLTYAILTQPTNGTVTLSGDQATYTPNLNYYGTDSFTFEAGDGTASSSPATVSVTVNSVNDLPLIALNGAPLWVPQNSTYVESGATATDTEDGDLTGDIVITGAVDTTTISDYTLLYTITDHDGGVATTSRTFHVYGLIGGSNGSSGLVGCMDPLASNYNPLAAYSSSCTYAGQVLGASTSTISNIGTMGTSTGSIGEVLGVSTTTNECATYITLPNNKALRQGAKNDFATVKLLQSFLNEFVPAKVPVTGYFGPLTTKAVNKFQGMKKENILKPWNLTDPTGVVFTTTVGEINKMKCAVPVSSN